MFDSVPPNLPTVGAGSAPTPQLPGASAATAPKPAAPASTAPSSLPAKPTVGGSPLIQEEHVTVMPSKFFMPPKARLPWKKIGLVALVVTVGGAAIVGVSMLVQSRLGVDQSAPRQSEPAPTPPAQQPTETSSAPTATPASPSGADATSSPAAPTPSVAVNPPPAPVVTPSGVATPSGAPSAGNGAAAGSPPARPDTKDAPLGPAVDTDTDGLSDSEEVVMGTDPSNPDTDQDRFPDGKEASNLFSPNDPDASKKLWETTVVNKYHHPSIGYELLYPSAWVARATSSTGEEIVFTSPTGPSVTVSAIANSEGLTAQQWYRKQYPDATAAPLKSMTSKSGVSGGASPTGLLAVYEVLSNGSRWIVVVQYHSAGETVATYKQLYGMIVGSFQIPTIKAFWNF